LSSTKFKNLLVVSAGRNTVLNLKFNAERNEYDSKDVEGDDAEEVEPGDRSVGDGAGFGDGEDVSASDGKDAEAFEDIEPVHGNVGDVGDDAGGDIEVSDVGAGDEKVNLDIVVGNAGEGVEVVGDGETVCVRMVANSPKPTFKF
jgi:hypothetical protein